MDKLHIQVEKYLKENFPKKHIVLNDTLTENGKNVELYGFRKIRILAALDKNCLYYKILTNK